MKNLIPIYKPGKLAHGFVVPTAAEGQLNMICSDCLVGPEIASPATFDGIVRCRRCLRKLWRE